MCTAVVFVIVMRQYVYFLKHGSNPAVMHTREHGAYCMEIVDVVPHLLHWCALYGEVSFAFLVVNYIHG